MKDLTIRERLSRIEALLSHSIPRLPLTGNGYTYYANLQSTEPYAQASIITHQYPDGIQIDLRINNEIIWTQYLNYVDKAWKNQSMTYEIKYDDKGAITSIVIYAQGMSFTITPTFAYLRPSDATNNNPLVLTMMDRMLHVTAQK